MVASHDVISIGSMILGGMLPLVALWLRLRFRLHRERERRSYLQVAAALPAGSHIREQRDDGTLLTVDVGNATRKER